MRRSLVGLSLIGRVLFALVFLAAAATGADDSLERVKKSGKLVWGPTRRGEGRSSMPRMTTRTS